MEIIEVSKIVGLCLFSYLFGSIPFGYIICWAKRVDIQRVGSGSIGGTNVRRALGLKYAVWVCVLDAWKGAVPVTVALYFLTSPWWLIGLVFLFCILGAIFSVWLKLWVSSFKAGKGMSTFIGALLVLLGWQWFVVISCWLLIFFFFVRRRMSIANLALTLIILGLFFVIPAFLYMLPTLLIIIGLIWWAHRENIQRIIRGQEPSTEIRLPWLFNKIPDDLIGWSIKKLQLLIKKLQNFKKEEL